MPINEILALCMIGAFFLMLLGGIPVAACLGITGLVFGYAGFGPFLFSLLPARIFGVITNYTLLALPLFIFMGIMLEKSKIAEELLDVIGLAMGGLRGGMALAIILVGVLMGAASGVVGATVVTMGLIALGPILRRGYDTGVAAGVICASGTLGQIIPPSLVLILLADIMGESVGTLFAAALFPGLLLAGLFVAYVLLLGVFKPAMVPAIDAEERSQYTRAMLARKIVKVVLPPIALIAAVLGSIIGGLATPTEAAAIGAVGAILLAASKKQLNLENLREVMQSTTRVTSMVFMIFIGASLFSLVFRGYGGEELVQEMLGDLSGGKYHALFAVMLVMFLLGFVLDFIEITFVVVPIVAPVLLAMGIDPIWLGIMIAINLQTSFLTPPFGFALFYLRGVAPVEIKTMQIYRGVMPFIVIQLLALGLIAYWPEIATWLPGVLG